MGVSRMTKEEYLNSDFVTMALLNNQLVYVTQINRKQKKRLQEVQSDLSKAKELEKENQQLKQQNEQLEKQIKDLESQLKYVIEDNDYYQKENKKIKQYCECQFCKHCDEELTDPETGKTICEICTDNNLWELA